MKLKVLIKDVSPVKIVSYLQLAIEICPAALFRIGQALRHKIFHHLQKE